MDFQLTDEQLDWRDEVRMFLKEVVTSELLQEVAEREDKSPGPLEKDYYRKIAEKGWTGINWPKEHGGLELSAIEQFIFIEEFRYAGAPHPLAAAVSIVAPALFNFGTEQNKKDWLPLIYQGEVEFALGYSEPEAGTDLASLSTTAILDGNEWVINGQKTWNTVGHRVSHQWAAVRTDPDARKHKGISVIIIPNDTPGVTLVKQKTWGDHTTNEVFFENVRVPKNNLIGNVNKGWNILMSALDSERIMMGSSAQVRRAYDRLVSYCKRKKIDGELLINRPDVQSKLAELHVELEIALLFGYRGASLIDSGKEASAEASMMKIFATELLHKVADFGLQIMDMYGQLSNEDEVAPLEGELEHLYRLAPFHRFGGVPTKFKEILLLKEG